MLGKFVDEVDAEIIIVEFLRSHGRLTQNTDQFRSHSHDEKLITLRLNLST